jgi:CRP-like cAMP-binding protein
LVPTRLKFRRKRSKDSRVAEQVSRVLSRIGTQAAVNALIESLLQFWTEQRESIDRNEALNQKSGAALRHPIIKALNRLRRDQPSLNFPKEQVYTGIRFEARNYAQILGWLHALTPISADDLLMLALKEKLTQSLECLFRTLGLIYPSQAIYNAYSPLHQQLTHPDSSRTALGPNALELLDNLLEPEIKRWVLPLIDDTPIETRLKHAETLWGQKAMTLSVMEGSDSWLRACAIYTFGQKTSLGRADELNLLEKVTFLKHTEIFADIPTEQLAKLAAVAQEVHFEDGSVIFEQNDYTDSMYILIEGHVQTSGEGGPDKTGVQSNPDTIGIQSDLSETIGEGEVFGMYALLTNEPRLVTARAIEETHVLKIERDAFFDLLSEHAEIALGLLKNMVQKIKALSIQPNLLHRQGESIK